MAVALRHDGGNDYLTTLSDITLEDGDIVEIKSRIIVNQTFAWLSSGPAATNAYIRWNGSTLRARGNQTGPSVAPPNGINLANNEFHIVQLHLFAATHKFNVDGFDTATLNGDVSSSLFNTLSAFFNSFFHGDLAYIRIYNSGGDKFYFDANASNTDPSPTTTLTETVTGNNAEGTGFPSDGSQWVTFGGADPVDLVFSNTTTQPTTDSLALGLITQLSMSNNTTQPIADRLTIQEIMSLGLSDNITQPIADNFSIVGIPTIDVSSNTRQPTADTINLASIGTLVFSDNNRQPTVDIVTIEQVSGLVLRDNSRQPSVDSLSVEIYTQLSFSDTLVQVSADSITLTSETMPQFGKNDILMIDKSVGYQLTDNSIEYKVI